METVRCLVCQHPVTEETGACCDYDSRHPPGCHAPLCWFHASVESEPGDPYGWDGVDIRCPQHATPHRQTVPSGQAWYRRMGPQGAAYD